MVKPETLAKVRPAQIETISSSQIVLTKTTHFHLKWVRYGRTFQFWAIWTQQLGPIRAPTWWKHSIQTMLEKTWHFISLALDTISVWTKRRVILVLNLQQEHSWMRIWTHLQLVCPVFCYLLPSRIKSTFIFARGITIFRIGAKKASFKFFKEIY